MSECETPVASAAPLALTPLHALHVALGAKMVPFAGYEMPLHYTQGIIREHQHTRAAAGLFDVSHMGQAFLMGRDHESVAHALESVTPGDFSGLGLGRMRYTVLLNDEGGIVDDMMVTRSVSAADDGALFLVVNAANKDADYRYITGRLPRGVSVAPVEARALLALQGPRAAEVMARHCPEAGGLSFMAAASARFDGIDCHVSRSGYTGEDGFEISLPADRAEAVARVLLAEPEVEPVGLGARDTLRLEAGLCLHGHDIDETTTPIEAALGWAIARRRREEGGFPGAARILREFAEGPARRRVGLWPGGRAPAREGTEIFSGGSAIGRVTSGGFGPTLNEPVAMGYVAAAHATPGTAVELLVRGTLREATVAELPFVPHRYARKATG